MVLDLHSRGALNGVFVTTLVPVREMYTSLYNDIMFVLVLSEQLNDFKDIRQRSDFHVKSYGRCEHLGIETEARPVYSKTEPIPIKSA